MPGLPWDESERWRARCAVALGEAGETRDAPKSIRSQRARPEAPVPAKPGGPAALPAARPTSAAPPASPPARLPARALPNPAAPPRRRGVAARRSPLRVCPPRAGPAVLVRRRRRRA